MPLSPLLLLVIGAIGDAARMPERRNATISIVNGQPANECEWKWQVGLTWGAYGDPYCGGMLIRPDWVLTAAHCVQGDSRVDVTAGEWKLSKRSGKEQHRVSRKIIVHPQYDEARRFAYDIALLKFDTPFDFNSCVGAVSLPTRDVEVEDCMITGWGTLRSGGSSPDVLQEAPVRTLTVRDCKRNTGYDKSDIDSSMLCAQGQRNGENTDACQGDSGGPLVCRTGGGGGWEIHGATSWGNGCAFDNYPGVWSRVYKALDWIEEKIGSASPSPPPSPSPPQDPEDPPPGGESCPTEFSDGPDEYGDCKCFSGLICRNNGVRRCPYSLTVEDPSEKGSLKWFLPNCTGCVCS